MEKKLLRVHLRTMLDNIRSTSGLDLETHKHVLILGGDETVFTLLQEGEPPLKVKQDPETKIGSSFALVDDGCVALNKYISEVDSDVQLHTKLGSSIEKEVIAYLRELRSKADITDSELDDAIDNQLNRLRLEVQAWTSIAPIDNLRFTDLAELTIGKVTFRPFASVRQRVLDELSERIEKNPTSDEEKQELKTMLEQQLDQHYGPNSVCAETVVEAAESRQQQIAYSEIDASLNLLRCYTHILFSWDVTARLGMRGQISFQPRPSFSFRHSDPSWTFHLERMGTALPYVLTNENVQRLRKGYELDRLSELLTSPESKRSKLERAVVTAIRWLGRGVDATDPPEKVLNFAAATERLMIGDDENKTEIAERFTRRLAFLITKDPNQRLRVGKRARELYKIRNSVIHAGRTDIEIVDVLAMESFALNAVLRMASRLNEWNTHKQFADWVEAQIFRARDGF